MAKGKGKKDSFQTESGNSASQGKVCITVPAALAKSFRLKEDIEDIHGYIDSLSPEELAMAAVRVGGREPRTSRSGSSSTTRFGSRSATPFPHAVRTASRLAVGSEPSASSPCSSGAYPLTGSASWDSRFRA